tara:strand:- start:170 stop:505 length:336 start_codon:yes stop_codon:yes gene_type:complete
MYGNGIHAKRNAYKDVSSRNRNKLSQLWFNDNLCRDKRNLLYASNRSFHSGVASRSETTVAARDGYELMSTSQSCQVFQTDIKTLEQSIRLSKSFEKRIMKSSLEVKQTFS